MGVRQGGSEAGWEGGRVGGRQGGREAGWEGGREGGMVVGECRISADCDQDRSSMNVIKKLHTSELRY